ncbi:Asparagine synthase, N-terminal domain [Caulobacteraceae bacterium]
MCGIAGLVSQNADLQSVAAAMIAAIAHRGPDGDGIWVDPTNIIALAHSRLAVVDLSEAGAQPISSPSGRYKIFYNGEIYNSGELKAELERERVAPKWRGHSDTEILLASIEHWGLSVALDRILGMFAFALWDSSLSELHLVRDRLGEKPLYYGNVGGAFVFASELKAIQVTPGFSGRVDKDTLALYFRRGYVPAPYSIYEGIYELPPGIWRASTGFRYSFRTNHIFFVSLCGATTNFLGFGRNLLAACHARFATTGLRSTGCPRQIPRSLKRATA